MYDQTFQWMMGLGLTGLGAMMLYLHGQTMKVLGDRIDGLDKRLTDKIDGLDKRLNDRIDGVEKSLSARMDKLDSRMDKLDEKLTDVDRRLCRIEGAMSTCCVLNHEQHRKAE